MAGKYIEYITLLQYITLHITLDITHYIKCKYITISASLTILTGNTVSLWPLWISHQKYNIAFFAKKKK